MSQTQLLPCEEMAKKLVAMGKSASEIQTIMQGAKYDRGSILAGLRAAGFAFEGGKLGNSVRVTRFPPSDWDTLEF